MTGAESRWASDLREWGIPDQILASAPESPWTCPVELFARRADAAPALDTPSRRAALEALPEGGSVLDVGCGAGAASLALSSRAGRLTGVDTSEDMLAAFRTRAESAGLDVATVEGGWPDVADDVPPADVVVCHHVAYNVPNLAEFALRLTDHARARVVVELTRRHPRHGQNPLWLRFHGLRRPDGPTVDDAMDVLREAGLEPQRVDWERRPAAGFATLEQLVANLRRELCLTADRDPEIADAVAGRVVQHDGGVGFPATDVTTLWWAGAAG